jgi:hypothetical protein
MIFNTVVITDQAENESFVAESSEVDLHMSIRCLHEFGPCCGKFILHLYLYVFFQCYFSFEKGSGRQRVTQNLMGVGWS